MSEDLPRYRNWVDARQASRLATAAPSPAGPELAFLLVVADRPDHARLRRCLRALSAQTSSNWRLSIAVTDDLSPEEHDFLTTALQVLPPGHIDVHSHESISVADGVARALDATTSPAVALLDVDDHLVPDAAALLSAALADADVAYADEDADDEGQLCAPMLKPDWSPELFLGWNYLGRPVALRRASVEAAGGIRALPDGDWEHDLLLRVTERTDRVAHVTEVLYHRRHHPGPRSDPGSRAVTEALSRRRKTADVERGPMPDSWHVRWRTDHSPAVTAVIPFRDSPRLLRACVDSVTATTPDVDLDLLLVDNGSEELETLSLLDRLADRPNVTIVRDPRPFNWAVLNNAAVAAAPRRSEVLLFLNNDIEALRNGWLGMLAAQALREEVGAVGARLVFPSGRLQHAGVVLGMAGAAGHVLVGLSADRPGYLGMSVLARDCSAVTGACLATRATVFERLGGFDETLGLDLNDIDYCLRARRRGLHVVFEPGAELVHHESPSRGTSGSAPDQLRFLDRWEDAVVAGDPFLNPHLTRVECSAALCGDDEEGWWRRWRSNLKR